MSVEEDVGDLLEEFRDYRKEIRNELKDHGETLVRLDERSVQQEKRMNWIQKKAGGWGALAGAIMSFFTSWLGA